MSDTTSSTSTYKIIRYFMKRPKSIIRIGVSLQTAQSHCSDPNTNSFTCASDEGRKRTLKFGHWFDGYEKE